MTQLPHIAFLVTLALSEAALAVAQPPVNSGAEIDRKFVERVEEYVKARNAAVKDLPALKTNNSPADVLARQGRLAARIQTIRAGARQGDICTPEVVAELKRLIGITMKGPDGPGIQKSLRGAELSTTLAPLAVNARFPDKLPVASTPPSLLLNLPRLPAEVEYRVVGRALVLRDSTANVIIDFVPDAIPVSR